MNNDDLLRRSLDAVWHPCTQMKLHETLPLVPIRRAEGAWLEDFDGRRYLDAISSWWVNLFGHGNPRIVAALREQLDTLDHVMLAGFTHEPVVALSEKLAALTVVDAKQLADGDGADADVVILDCPDPIVRKADGNPERIAVPKVEKLTVAVGRPVIVVGGMAMVTDRLQLKSNWL